MVDHLSWLPSQCGPERGLRRFQLPNSAKECAEGKRRAKFVPLAPDDFANEVKAIIEKNGDDFERSRLNLDTLVHDVLKQLGYTAGVEMIEKVPQY